MFDDGWRPEAFEKGRTSVHFWRVDMLQPNKNCTEVEQAGGGGDQKQRWGLEPRKAPGERWEGRLARSPEADAKGPSHLRDQNRVGPRGRVQRRWTPALSWKKGCGESSRRNRILAQLGSWANPNLPWVRSCWLSRSYQGQQGKDGVLFKLWQNYFCSIVSIFVCVCVCSFWKC